MQLDFDPTKVTYEALVEKFFAFHHAALAPSSGQYMSAIFVSDDDQERIARSVMRQMQENSSGTIQTRIIRGATFHLAEDYHQKYALQGDGLLISEYRAIYPDIWDLVNSTAATRVNAYLYGFGTPERLRAELESLGLSATARDHLLSAMPAGTCPVE